MVESKDLVMSTSTDLRNEAILNGNEYTEILIPVPWGQISAYMVFNFTTLSGPASKDVLKASLIELQQIYLDKDSIHTVIDQVFNIKFLLSACAYGDSSNTPVLAVHGWMDNAGTFARLVPMLFKSLYIVAVDMPGHGKSSHLPPGVPYHFMDFIISLRRISEYFKWNKYYWLSHSMGAALGAIYASLYPGDVERLVMLDIVKPATRQSSEDVASRLATGIDYFLKLDSKIEPVPPCYTYETALTRMMSATVVSRKGAEALMTRGSIQLGPDKWCYSRDLRLRSPSILRLSDDQCYSILSNIRCATLIIKASGGYIDDTTEDFSKILEIYQQNCSKFTYTTVKGNHHVHLNEPDECAQQINEFLLDNNI